MRLAIVGSRDFPKLSAVRRFVLALPDDTVVISGHARGVDQMAEHTARFERGLEVVSFQPKPRPGREWAVVRFVFEGKDYHEELSEEMAGRWPSFAAAAYTRNRFIVDAADVVVAFWDGESKGTKHSIDLAESMGRRVELYGKDSVT